MISALVLFGLCASFVQAPVLQEPVWHKPVQQAPAQQELVQHELQLHQIAGLIDLAAELRGQMTSLEEALLNLSSRSDEAGGADHVDGSLSEIATEAILGEQSASGFRARNHWVKADGPYSFASANDLVKNAKWYMVPAFDSAQQSLKIENNGNSRVLLAYLQPVQQQWLANFLQMQREIGSWQAHMNVQVLKAPFRDAIQDYTAATVFGSTAEAEAMSKQLKEAGASVLSSPSILTLPGQLGTIAVQKQSFYVSDWKMVKVQQPSQAVVADPTIEIVEEGMVFNARALQAGTDSYGIAIDLKMSRVEEPFGTKEIMVDGRKFEIGAPQVITANIATNIKLPSGGGVMLRSPHYDEEHDLVLIFTFNRTNSEE